MSLSRSIYTVKQEYGSTVTPYQAEGNRWWDVFSRLRIKKAALAKPRPPSISGLPSPSGGSACCWSIPTNVDLAPANIELAALDLELTRAYSREHIVRRAIEPLRAQYDYLVLDTIDAVTNQLNPNLHIAGIVLTMADQRTSHTRQIIELTRTTFANQIRVFESLIKLNVRLKEAPILGQSILHYDPISDAAKAYRQLAEEIAHVEARSRPN